ARLPELIGELAPALLPLLDKPCVFFGHSMGAILSFEVTRWLRRNRGVLPRHLFVSGRRAPQISDTDPPLHLLNDEDFLARIRELDGTPAEVLADEELLRVVLPVLRADTELCETYEYVDDSPLPCPITAFAGKDDDDETSDKVREWNQQTTSRFSFHSMEGGHFFISSSEQEVLRLLKRELSYVYRQLLTGIIRVAN